MSKNIYPDPFVEPIEKRIQNILLEDALGKMMNVYAGDSKIKWQLHMFNMYESPLGLFSIITSPLSLDYGGKFHEIADLKKNKEWANHEILHKVINIMESIYNSKMRKDIRTLVSSVKKNNKGNKG